MATVPTMITWVTGQVVTAAQMNSTNRDLGNFVLAPPLAILRQTVGQSISNAAWTPLTFDTEDIDRDNGHSTVTNTSRYTAQTQGYYRPDGKIGFPSNATGRRWSKWTINGVDVSAAKLTFGAANGDFTQIPAPSRRVFLNVSDYLELQAFQDSGGALTTVVSTGEQSLFNLEWMST